MEIIETIPKLLGRAVDGHKGDYGKVLIVAGSVGMSGAAALAGRSALRAGAGLVRVATSKSAQPVVAAIEPCYTTIALAEDGEGRMSARSVNGVLSAVSENDCVAVGPGIGVSVSLRALVKSLVEQPDLRVLIDGDGLNNLSKIKNWPARCRARVILTPHPGEMQRLWAGLMREKLPRERTEQAAAFAKSSKSLVVLKGAGTVVTDGERVYINKTGNPGMATAGAGDVLTGVIAALMGQGLSDFDSAVLGVYIHGLAGDIVAEVKGQVSLMATDIIEALPEAFKRFGSA